MAFDGACNAGLVLGLSLSSSADGSSSSAKNSGRSLDISRPLTASFDPALTLGISGEGSPGSRAGGGGGGLSGDELYRQESGGASSFSNGSVKREREAGSEEGETDRGVSSRVVSDEDDDGVNGRKKLRLTKPQSALLEECFKRHSTLNPKQKQELARELKLRPRQVEVWFQNRRARTKLKQTEMDCENLKKFCETLTDENRRLHRELQELKTLKLPQPPLSSIPIQAATLTMCPSCERVGDRGPAPARLAPKGPFPMAPKTLYFNPFANPSAAC